MIHAFACSITAAVGTSLRFIDHTGRATGQFIRPQHDLALRWMQLFSCPVSCGAVVFRKSVVWDELGGFDPSISIAQDWELWSRMPPEYKLANLPDLLLDVRKHPGCDTIVFRDIIFAEGQRINRANPQRILGITDDSEEWLSKVDTLIAERVDHPEHRLEVIEVLSERFYALYPTAREDPEVLKELSRQYVRVLCHTDLRSLPTTFRVLRLA